MPKEKARFREAPRCVTLTCDDSRWQCTLIELTGLLGLHLQHVEQQFTLGIFPRGSVSIIRRSKAVATLCPLLPAYPRRAHLPICPLSPPKLCTLVTLSERLPSWASWVLRPLAWLLGIAMTLVLVVAALVAVALSVA